MSEFSTAIAAMHGTNVAGVYRIGLVFDERCYVGSSQNIGQRWNIHYRRLRRGDHHSRYLQHAWNKYGEDAFYIEVIETCELDALLLVEQFWIDTLQSAFNMQPLAGRAAGFKHSPETRQKLSELRKGTTMPPETRSKISVALKGREQVGGFHGKQHTPESRAKMSASHKAAPPKTTEHCQKISDTKITNRSTTCKYGHPFTDDNIQWRKNQRGTWVRRCLTCHRLQGRRSKMKAKEQAANGDG